jgi:hypothetical protein
VYKAEPEEPSNKNITEPGQCPAGMVDTVTIVSDLFLVAGIGSNTESSVGKYSICEFKRAYRSSALKKQAVTS